MVDLSTFVENRRQGDMNKKRRQVVGDRHRVPVPPTRFDRAVSAPEDQHLSILPVTPSLFTLESEPLGRPELHGFDTDAESIGDSTTMGRSTRTNHASQPTPIRKNIALTAIAASQYTYDQSRGQYEEPRPADFEQLVPSFDDINSGGNSTDQRMRSHDVRRDLDGEYRSERFIEFKKRNVLRKSSFDASHAPQDHVPDRHPMASSYAPIGAVETTITMSSQSPTPAHQYANSMSIPKSQYPADAISKFADFPNYHENRNDQDALSSSVVEEHLAEVKHTDQHCESHSQPLSQNAPVKLGHAHRKIELASIPDAIPTKSPFPHQTDQKFADQSILGSESSDEHGPDVRNGNEITRGTFKRKPSLDHSSDQLRNMNFQDLLNDPFERISTPVASLQGSGVTGPPLYATLEQLISNPNSQDYYLHQQSFFELLTLGQYVDCGEVIAGKLNEIILNLSRIRQEKRRVVGQFEVEVVHREATIRNRAAGLRKKKGIMTRQTEELTAMRTAQIEANE